MITNFHTHSTFCDGKNTPEETVLYAIDNGFCSIGFSGHGYTDFDLRYCMKQTDEYIKEINRLKEKYKDKIQIYLGVEEDAFCYVNRDDFDYIIGSSHYFLKDGKYYPIDSNYDYFKECLKVFDYDIEKLSNAYYETFCAYILKRKPDIVGHFDLITKFDEIDVTRFLNNEKYFEIAEKYIKSVANTDVVFEINTGAISRGFRKNPYPHERLLKILKENGSKVILASDCHDKENLCYGFSDAKILLRDIGFDSIYTIYDNSFKKISIK
ncbi:MAG: histidinol-phosphatase HisJ family protein [Ruminococcaceae bacterium]|nr:histidinol-phosphatase HisJ family protein [Oscillospiraceae bacterium]